MLDRFIKSRNALWVLGLFSILVFSLNHDWTEFWWTDEARHALDGVFFRDFFLDLPLFSPMAYVEEYFARFPALGFTWYLPFFAVSESIFFLVFGIGTATTKLHMLAWFVVLALSTFQWGKKIDGRHLVAFLGVILLLTNAQVLLWGRSIMLEIPALAMMMLSLLGAERYLHKPTYQNSFLLGLVLLCMLMTKQTTVFILGVIVIGAVCHGQWKLMFRAEALPALLLAVLGIAGMGLHALVFGKSGMQGVSSIASSFLTTWIGKNIPVMLGQMRDVFGLFVWIAAALGTFFMVRSGEIRSAAVLWSWIALGVFFLPLITGEAGNLQRYCIYLAPGVYYLAARILFPPWPNSVIRYGTAAFLLLAALPGILKGLTLEQPRLDGYEDVADFVSSLEIKGPVMFCCKHDGNYTFFRRRNDPDRESITLRADKVLVSIVISEKRGILAHTDSLDDIRLLLNDNGVQYLVLEDKTLTNVKQFEQLREMAHTEDFESLKKFDITSSDPAYDGIVISVYRHKHAPPIAGKSVTIPFPHLGRSITLDINKNG